MRDTKITALIGKSVDRTQEILFKPFRWKKWMALIAIAIMAGSLQSGGNIGGGGGGGKNQKPAIQGKITPTPQDQQSGADADAAEEKVTPTKPSADSAKQFFKKLLVQAKTPFGIAMIALAVVAGLISFLLWDWMSCRFSMVWVDSVVRNSAAMGEPYRRYRKEGGSLFVVSVAMHLIAGCLILACGLWIYAIGAGTGAWNKGFDWSFGIALKIFAVPSLVLLVWSLAMIVLYIAIEHFVIPLMAMNRVTFVPAARQFAGIFGPRPGEFGLYCLVLIGLGLLLGAIGLVLVLAIFIVFILAGLLIFGLTWLIIAKLLHLGIVFTILAVVIGIPFGLFAMFVLTGAKLVFAIFFRCFSIYFLLAQNSELAPATLEDAAARNPAGEPARFPWFNLVACLGASLFSFGGIIALIAVAAVQS